MKKPLLLVLAFALPASWCVATELPPAATERLDREQIEILISPIALYPDPLVALILPASTRPSDIVLAARYLERGGNPDDTQAQPWESSVKALARYGEVITYLDENLAWTQSLGECFLEQPEDIMSAIQTLRARARTAGLLMDTAEQEIIVEEEEIRIVPARPTVIYVPRYDPEVLYVSYSRPYYGGPFLVFGLGYSVGSWLSYDCDWRHRTVLVVQRPVHWYHQPNWRARHVHVGTAPWQRWAPSPQHKRHHIRPARATTDVVLRPSRDWESTRQSRLAASASRPHGSTRPSTWQRPADNRPQMNSTTPRASRPDLPANRRDSRMTRETERPATIAPSTAAPAVASASGPSPTIPRATPGATHRRSGNDGSTGPTREYRSRSDAPNRETSTAPARITASPQPAQTRGAADSSPRASRSEASGRHTRPDKPDGRQSHRDVD